LFALSWTSPFSQLQFGHVDPPALAATMAPRIADHMKKPNIVFMVARHPETGQVVSVAEWNIPVAGSDKEQKDETVEEKKERQRQEDETYRSRLPENSNKDLIMEFTVGLRTLREQTLGRRQHYCKHDPNEAFPISVNPLAKC
jgi:hypothetical protein